MSINRAVVGGLLAGVMIAGTAGADSEALPPRCRSVQGVIAGVPFSGPGCPSPLGKCSRGTISPDPVRGGIKGTFLFAATAITESADTGVTGIHHYTADVFIKTSDGTIFLKDAGAVDARPGSTGDVAAVSTLLRGSGAWAGVRGRLRLMGTFDPERGGRNTYEGFVCLP